MERPAGGTIRSASLVGLAAQVKPWTGHRCARLSRWGLTRTERRQLLRSHPRFPFKPCGFPRGPGKGKGALLQPNVPRSVGAF